jgi:hypothetical protein
MPTLPPPVKLLSLALVTLKGVVKVPLWLPSTSKVVRMFSLSLAVTGSLSKNRAMRTFMRLALPASSKIKIFSVAMVV